MGDILGWLQTNLPKLESECASQNSLGDLETMNLILNEHCKLNEEIEHRRPNVQAINAHIKKMVSFPDSNEYVNNVEKLDQLNDEWQRMEIAAKQKVKEFSNDVPI
jgi:hypothetical protein